MQMVRMGSRNIYVLAFCLLAMLALTSATYVKPKPPKCSPVREFGACQLFVTKGYWNKWAPNKYSACCRYVKKESLDCLCAAANSKFKFQVDISKALGLAAKCGKYYPKGTVLKCKTREFRIPHVLGFPCVCHMSLRSPSCCAFCTLLFFLFPSEFDVHAFHSHTL